MPVSEDLDLGSTFRRARALAVPERIDRRAIRRRGDLLLGEDPLLPEAAVVPRSAVAFVAGSDAEALPGRRYVDRCRVSLWQWDVLPDTASRIYIYISVRARDIGGSEVADRLHRIGLGLHRVCASRTGRQDGRLHIRRTLEQLVLLFKILGA